MKLVLPVLRQFKFSRLGELEPRQAFLEAELWVSIDTGFGEAPGYSTVGILGAVINKNTCLETSIMLSIYDVLLNV